MSDPSLSELYAQIAARCARIEKARLAGRSQAQNEIGLQDTDEQANEGAYGPESLAASGRFRASWNSLVSPERIREMLDPIIKRVGIAILSPETDPAAILDDWFEYMQAVAVAAQGTLTLDTNPTDADTMTIGAVTYRFKSSMGAAEDIQIGADAAATQVSIVKTLLGTGVPGTDFYAGSSTPHPTVTCGTAFAANVLTLTARAKGTAGNSLTTTKTFTAGTNVFNAATLGTTTAGVAPLTVQSRVFSFGNVAAAATNVGNMTVYRSTTDWTGRDIESCYGADKITLECTAGRQEGAPKHQEAFRISSKAQEDALAERGSGLTLAGVQALSCASESLIANPSFSQMTPATDGSAVTALTSWTDDSGALTSMQVSLGTANDTYYRDYEGDSVPKALDLRASRTVYQVLRRSVQFDRPYIFRLAYKPENSGAGLLSMRLRSYTTPATPGVVLASTNVAISGSTWQILYMVAHPRVFLAGNDIALEIQWARTAGNLLLDDVLACPATLFDNLAYFLVDGLTDCVKGDSFSFTDTVTEAIIQRMLARGYNKYLPHVNGTETITEPTVT